MSTEADSTKTKDNLRKQWPAIAILAAYLLVGIFYAIFTPPWQVPDEPAHYNYIRALASGQGLPILEPGDYNQPYLEQLTSNRFPPQLSISEVEYEDHQPPLYYLLATPIFLLFGGALLPLRLFSLLLGGAGLIALMALGREVFPNRPGLAWLAGGLAAFLPQHLAMLTGVNNDALTEALLFLWLFLALRYLRGVFPPAALGGLLGALLITKGTAYGVIALGLLAVAIRWRREGRSWRWGLQQALLLYSPALLIGALWWGRSLAIYGWPDVVGMIRHNEVVVGQPRTAEWIATYGWGGYLERFFRTTFQSFWGQFGWMGVVLDQRIYLGLALFSGLMFWGALWQLIETLRQGFSARQKSALLLLGALAFITFGVIYLGYNTTFVQHQGRYLFPALPALTLAGAVGLTRLAERRLAAVTLVLFSIVFLSTLLVGLLHRDLPLWNLALILAAPAAVMAAAWTSERWRPMLGALLLLGLFVLDWVCLFGFIVPALS